MRTCKGKNTHHTTPHITFLDCILAFSEKVIHNLLNLDHSAQVCCLFYEQHWLCDSNSICICVQQLKMKCIAKLNDRWEYEIRMGGGRGRNDVENSVCRFEPRSCAYVITSFSWGPGASTLSTILNATYLQTQNIQYPTTFCLTGPAVEVACAGMLVDSRKCTGLAGRVRHHWSISAKDYLTISRPSLIVHANSCYSHQYGAAWFFCILFHSQHLLAHPLLNALPLHPWPECLLVGRDRQISLISNTRTFSACYLQSLQLTYKIPHPMMLFIL